MRQSTNRLMIEVFKRHVDRSRAIFSAMGLSRGQPPVLMVLGEEDGQTQSALSERLHIRPASLSTIIQRMEQAGLVERKTHHSDHRAVQVFLTSLGKARRHLVSEALGELEREMLVGFDEEEHQTLRDFLQRLEANLRK